MRFKAYLTSMRPRTLLLSEAGVLLGTFIAYRSFTPDCTTVALLLLTTALLQILSNLSNELGDTLHGTDSNDRQGIHYSLQDGMLTVGQMKRFIRVICALCCISGIAMTYNSFGTLLATAPVLLLVLGAAAIWAAMHYTLGRNPYGYRGLGDLSVFIFFGLVSVCGGYYVCSHDLCNRSVLLPACGIGCFSVAVLNVNNIRDMASDRATRTTVAIKLGGKCSRIYQTALIVAGWLFVLGFTALTYSGWYSWIYVVTLPLFALHLRGVWNLDGRALDGMLPLLVVSTFALSVLMGIAL